MDVRALLAPDAAARLGESRARVFDLLRMAPGPLGVRVVADRTGLHPNTARFHLDALVEAGLAARAPQSRRTPGRPSMAYRVADRDRPVGERRYRLLAEMLTGLIATAMPDPARAAAEAGREWGRHLTGPPSGSRRPTAAQAVADLAATLDEVGFAPEAEAQRGGYRLRLRSCPFFEVAERHKDVVCSLHLGFMQGVLAGLRAPVTAEHLQPFAEPGVCVAHLKKAKVSGRAD